MVKMYAVHGNQQRIPNSINTKVHRFTFFERKIKDFLKQLPTYEYHRTSPTNENCKRLDISM